MRNHLRPHTETLLPVLAAFILLLPGPALAEDDIFDPDAEYSAVRVIKVDEGEATMRVFHTRDKERFVVGGGEQSMTMITRLDKQISWILIPDEKMYMEIPLDQASDQIAGMGFGQEAELRLEGDIPENFKKVGTETIAGLETTKYRGEIEDDDTGGSGTATYWVTDSGIVAKMEYEGVDEDGKPQKMVMELRELKIGKQPAKLFELPADYEPMRLNFGPGAWGMFGDVQGDAAASSQPPPRMSQQGEDEQEDSTDIVSDITREAGDEARNSVTDEVKRSVRDAVKGLFGR